MELFFDITLGMLNKKYYLFPNLRISLWKYPSSVGLGREKRGSQTEHDNYKAQRRKAKYNK